MLEEFKKIMQEIDPNVDVTCMNENTVLDYEYGLDSLRMMMFIIELEKRFHVKIENFPNAKTVGELMQFIQDTQAKQAK